MREKLHYDWHWVWDTGNGEIGNQGPHELDLSRWALGQPTLPTRVMSLGGRFAWNDDGETPNTQITIFDYQPAPLIFEVQNLPISPNVRALNHYRGVRVGFVVQCEGGYYAGGVGGYVYDHNGKKIRPFKSGGAENHLHHFIDAVRERDSRIIKAPLNEGFISSSLSHLANISYRLGVNRPNPEARDAIQGFDDAGDTLARIIEHLATNGVDLTQHPLRLGPWMEFNPASERFTGGPSLDRANQLLTRNYREPFVVPARI